MGFAVNDRRVTSLGALPVKDPTVASDLATRPFEADGVESYIPTKAVEPQFDLGQLQLVFGEYRRHHATIQEPTRWMKQFKALLAPVVKQASLLTLGGNAVATYRYDGKLATKRLEEEQPHIHAKYMRRVSKLEFDEEAFRAEEPVLHQLYRGRSFRLVNGGEGKGLVLPA